VVTSDSAAYVVAASKTILPSTSEGSFVSLESILNEKRISILHSQRLKIAHAIASSHLRLHPTQWLGRRWHSRDVIFAIKDGLPLLEQPYLRRQSLRNSTGPPGTAVWDDATLTLGILLIELCLNQPIASLAEESHDTGVPSASHEDVGIARKWYQELNGRTDDDYDEAVRWCINTTIRTQDIDSEWRQNMQDRVIKPLEKLCSNSASTSLTLDFNKAAWALRAKVESSLILCKRDNDDDPIYEMLALKEAYCPDNALEELIRQNPKLLKRVYMASRLCCLSQEKEVDMRAFRMDETNLHDEADDFYVGLSKQTTFQKVLGTLILAMTDPPSKAWFKAWDRFTACCRGKEPHLSEMMITYFPFDEDVVSRLYRGHHPANTPLSPFNIERADLKNFGFSQYCFCAAQLVPNRQLHDHSMNDKHRLRMPFTSIERIGGGSSSQVYRVGIRSGHYDDRDHELAMKVLKVGPKTPDEWNHTACMMKQLQTHECIMRAKTSLRFHQQVLVFYEAADCDLYSYMTKEEPPSYITRAFMLDAIREVADALNWLHVGLSHEAAAMACSHKDIKAENILVTWRPDKRMRLKLTDFGISSIIHERSLPTKDHDSKTLQYTPREHKTPTDLGEDLHNAPPETHNNGLVDASADIWAFGTVLADYVVWLFGGRDSLGGFERAKSEGYTNHAYYCVSEAHPEQNDSLLEMGTPKDVAHFVLKAEIEEWFDSMIDLVRKDRSISGRDGKMLEDCWWLLKCHMLVCNPSKRGKSEDILLWLGEIYKGTFIQPVNTESTTKLRSQHRAQTNGQVS
jgi:serine/threonine protein kinase